MGEPQQADPAPDADRVCLYNTLMESDAGAVEFGEALPAAAATHGVHLVVLVHGLAGNTWDMRLFKDYLAIYFPSYVFLVCTSMESDSLADIAEMGQNIAKEVCNFIEEEVGPGLRSISFVGHSLGGIVIRAALATPTLRQYNHLFNTYMSLSTPHLSTVYSKTKLLPSAMWLWQKWTKSQCLRQLRMRDAKDPFQTYLYGLSTQQVLAGFRHVVLLYSEQDQYVPTHSACVEVCPAAARDPKYGGAITAMVSNLLSPILANPRCSLTRYNIIFGQTSLHGVDALLGRAARTHRTRNSRPHHTPRH
eukprot:TRINITY_DN2395_c1_g1_i2.p1 TRINITY_DN2395_c1_g1~~TRINITY_DN2395_c1_g1_i2.p1  ORF type:complete len:306 (+),score=74.41 TRINITY_DN2395_c1_g1_i2:400-1317(+)